MKRDSEYVPLAEFARRLKVDRKVVERWARHEIPVLGKPLETQLLPKGGRHRPMVQCAKTAIIDEIREAKRIAAADLRQDEIDRHGEKWLRMPIFAQQSTLSKDRTRYYAKNPCYLLGGRRIRKCIVLGKNRGARGTYFLAANDAKTIAAALAKDQGDWIWVTEAAKKLGRHRDVVLRWTQRAIPALGNRPLRHENRVARVSSGHTRPRLFVSRSDIERIQDVARSAGPDEITIDGKTYLTAKAAARFCKVSRAAVYKWHQRTCCHLARRLEGRSQVKASTHRLTRAAGGDEPTLYVLLSDLQLIHANKRESRKPSRPVPAQGLNGHDQLPVESTQAAPSDPPRTRGKRGRRINPERDAAIYEAAQCQIHDKVAFAFGLTSRSAVSKICKRHLNRQNGVNQIKAE
jgi:hypothetical protein